MNTSSSTFTRRAFAVQLAFAFIYLAWGATYLATKFAIVDLPVFLMSGARFFFAGVLLLAGIAWFDRAGFRRGTLREWRDASIISLLLLDLGIGTGNWTQQYVSSSFAAMVFSGLPLWIIVIDWLRPGGRAPTRTVAVALLLGFAGIGLILAPTSGSGAGKSGSVGIGLVLVLASISWAAGAIFSRHVRARGSALLATARQMIVAGAVLLLVGVIHGDVARVEFVSVRASAWLGFGYLLLVGSLGGYPVYLWLMRTCPPAKAATIPYINLLVAVFLGWTIGHETITPRVLAGTAIVLVSVALVLRAKEKSPAQPGDANDPPPLTEEQLPATTVEEPPQSQLRPTGT
jgi:drug/metabolite transporter (DMT)-like permease